MLILRDLITVILLNEESTQQFELGLKMAIILGDYCKKNIEMNVKDEVIAPDGKKETWSINT